MMANILANSEAELKQIQDLLNKDLPSYRQAYSDRTAWIMSCLSELAYIRFNPLFSNDDMKDYFLEKINSLIDTNKKSALLNLIDIVGYDSEVETEKLNNELKIVNMELLETYDNKGTQAILVAFGDFIVLAYRGTEASSIKDIKADAKATTTTCESGGNIHSGFKEAYGVIDANIKETLKKAEYINKPLFITGHSLGGALATVAAKKLTHQGGLAACYTFGAPRVGDETWISTIKTPVYRLVNAADCVTMLPPSAETIAFTGFIFNYIPWVGKKLRSLLLSNFGGYFHCGSMRYLTNCSNGDYKNAKLLPSVSTFYRLKGFLVKKLPWKHLLADHSISIYRKKLKFIAEERNIS